MTSISLNIFSKIFADKYRGSLVCLLLALVLLALSTACSGENGNSPIENEPEMGTQRNMEIDGMQQVYVPEGLFLMGESSSYFEETARKNEAPRHQVMLTGYWIDKTEVTADMYAQFLTTVNPDDEVLDTYLTQTSCFEYNRNRKSWETKESCENEAVHYVTWYGAAAYCEWAGRRLPTEAEWEKAARGENGATYPWGNAAVSCRLAQYADCDPYVQAVGSRPLGASVYGAMDMSGNVWEWVSDVYADNYRFRNSPSDALAGPSYESETHVIRGGSWRSEAFMVRVTVRAALNSGETLDDLGFRCASSD